MSTKSRSLVFCGGWTPFCVWLDWLREAQVDHEVDWPSACTALKRSQQGGSSGSPWTSPVMQEVTGRIMNRPECVVFSPPRLLG